MRGGEKCEGFKRRYIFSKEVWRPFKEIINVVGKQGELLKRFKDSDELFDGVSLSWSNIYFKIRLYKFLCKFPALRNSTLTSSYFKNNFKMIKKVCKANADVFDEKK